MTQLQCPFLPLCEREFSGSGLSEDEQSGLHDHLSDGCEVCEQRIEAHLSGSDDSLPEASNLRELDQQLSRAVAHGGQAMEQNRLVVLERVKDTIGKEDAEERRRVRRRLQRVLFYVVNVAAVCLLVTAYVGTAMAHQLMVLNARRMQADTEAKALATALVAWAADHPGEALPHDLPALVNALHGRRSGRETTYFRFDPERLRDRVLTDPFLHGKAPPEAYRYVPRRDRAHVYSVGPDGRDDGGAGDDIGHWVQFTSR